MVMVGDQVTTKRNPKDWATVIKVGGSDELPMVDIEYQNGGVETGIPWAGIDQHAPKD
ncbi:MULTISPECIES: hypothetical protein [Serratia]|uniref:hypothetical protein n=1 Tax=Serratia TaxID=613 RepID=UPI0013CEFAC2|nr:hypothetical protein [Serratia marcescens]